MPSPIRIFSARATSAATKSSAMDSSTISRVPAEHTWPECRNTPVSTWSTAARHPVATSANTMCGFLPPSSTATLVTCSAATLEMVRPGGQPAGERDEVDVRGVGQRGAERGAAALHQVHHRRRAPRPPRADGRTRSCDSGVTSLGLATIVQPAAERGRDLPRHLQQRIVPRRDQHAHPDGFAHHPADHRGIADVDQPVAHSTADELGVVAEHRRDVVDVDPALGQRLSGVPGLQPRQRLLVALQQIGDPVEQRGALGDGGGRPCAVVERRARRGDGVACVLGGGLVDDRGDAAVGGVDDRRGSRRRTRGATVPPI